MLKAGIDMSQVLKGATTMLVILLAIFIPGASGFSVITSGGDYSGSFNDVKEISAPSDSAIIGASSLSGIKLESYFEGSGDFKEDYIANNGMGEIAKLTVDISKAKSYEINPPVKTETSSIAKENELSLTANDANSIKTTAEASNRNAECAYGSIEVQNGSITGLISTAAATPDSVFIIQTTTPSGCCNGKAEGREIKFETGARKGEINAEAKTIIKEDADSKEASYITGLQNWADVDYLFENKLRAEQVGCEAKGREIDLDADALAGPSHKAEAKTEIKGEGANNVGSISSLICPTTCTSMGPFVNFADATYQSSSNLAKALSAGQTNFEAKGSQIRFDAEVKEGYELRSKATVNYAEFAKMCQQLGGGNIAYIDFTSDIAKAYQKGCEIRGDKADLKAEAYGEMDKDMSMIKLEPGQIATLNIGMVAGGDATAKYIVED